MWGERITLLVHREKMDSSRTGLPVILLTERSERGLSSENKKSERCIFPPCGTLKTTSIHQSHHSDSRMVATIKKHKKWSPIEPTGSKHGCQRLHAYELQRCWLRQPQRQHWKWAQMELELLKNICPHQPQRSSGNGATFLVNVITTPVYSYLG